MLPAPRMEINFMPTSRREFIAGLGALALFPIERAEPDLILHNANVWTINPRQPRAQAIAISNGRFYAIGMNEEILALAAGSAKKIDLGGNTVLPGFIDAHSHPAEAGLDHLRMVDCDLRSIAEILAALRKQAAKIPPGQWVLGFKYDDTKTSDGRPLSLRDLDEALPDHPVFVEHRGGHTAWVNSLALKLTKIDDKTPDPSGGQYDHDPATGQLTGHVRENAKEAFRKLIPTNFTRDDHREGVKLIAKMMSRTGITSVTDALGSPDDLRAYQDARASGDLSVRVYCSIFFAHIQQMLDAGIRTGLGDEWVRVGVMKMICDGSISERTARLSQPYIGRPNDFGILVSTEDELYERARKAHEAGWQIGTHANGDVGIDIDLARLRTPAKGNAASRSTLPVGTLHGDQRLAGAADQGSGCDPHAVFHLRLLSWRKDERVRCRASRPHVRLAELYRRRRPSRRRLPTTLLARSSR